MLLLRVYRCDSASEWSQCVYVSESRTIEKTRALCRWRSQNEHLEPSRAERREEERRVQPCNS